MGRKIRVQGLPRTFKIVQGTKTELQYDRVDVGSFGCVRLGCRLTGKQGSISRKLKLMMSPFAQHFCFKFMQKSWAKGECFPFR